VKRPLRFILIFTNIVCALALLLTYTASFTDPINGWYFPVFGLAYPYLLTINIAWAIFWIIQKKPYALLSVLCISIGWPRPARVFALSSPTEVTAETASIKFMSYNVRLFNRFGWKEKGIHLREDIAQFVEGEQPDIMVWQEFYHAPDRPEHLNLPYIQQTGEYPYYFLQPEKIHSTSPPTYRYFDLATFSKYPIVEHGFLKEPSRKKGFCSWADIRIPDQTIRVYNVHLQSIKFRQNDLDFIESGGAEETREQSLRQTRQVLQKIRNSAIKRAHQIRMLKEHLESCPYPAIVAGDFNESAFNYGYAQLEPYLQDGFTKAGNGLGYSYDGFGALPPQRIDFILASNAFTFVDFTTHDINYSDHEPLTATLALSQP